MDQRQDRGYFGEQGTGFILGGQGYFLVDGPSGSSEKGHAANAHGFDGIAFNPTTNDLICYDNKCFISTRNVSSATAIDPAKTLAKNLDNLIARLSVTGDIPRRYQILDLLRRTRLSLTVTGMRPPPNVRFAVTNYGGNSGDITRALRNRGLTFIDMRAAPSVPAPTALVRINRVTILQTSPFISSGVAAYNARRNTMEAAAVAAASGAQVLNDMALRHAIEGKLQELYDDISETVITKGGALVLILVSALAPVGCTVTRSVASAYIVNQPPGLIRQQSINLFQSQPQMFSDDGPNVGKEMYLYWYGPKS